MNRLMIAVSLLAVACDAESTTPTQPTTVISLGAELVGAQFCFALRVVNAAGETVFERGVPSSKPATLEEALASGAVCAESRAEVDARCELGPSEARVWNVGFFADGLRIEEDYIEPCGELGCMKAFECLEADNPGVAFDFNITRRSYQGFFDLSVYGEEAPEGADAICYTFRVENGEGVEVLTARRLCSNQYGNGRGGDLSYIVPCDARAAENTVTVWVHPPEGATVPYETACPAPTSGEVSTWTGGCTQAQVCFENEDRTVSFDFEAEAR